MALYRVCYVEEISLESQEHALRLFLNRSRQVVYTVSHSSPGTDLFGKNELRHATIRLTWSAVRDTILIAQVLAELFPSGIVISSNIVIALGEAH